LEQVQEALEAGADEILLDNMDLETLRKAAASVRENGRRSEASGGVGLETVGAIAETGVDSISVGALTHSALAIDLSLEIEQVD
jgi:nicotinate-nucleotide pyrophosphorylase (carboxylating)